jgi:3-dehydroshikimate dehydratase
LLKLAAFADEIGPDLDEQIAVCRQHGVTHFELRGVDGRNVLDFSRELRRQIKTKLDDAGLGVACIGSPIGKVALDRPWEEHLDRFKLAVESAAFFDAPLIRVFSYYPAGGEGRGDQDAMADEVARRFSDKLDLIQNTDVSLVHENEKGIFGDIGRRCEWLMRTLDAPKLRCAFDFANFVQSGERPLENWPKLKPYTAHIHIKDAKAGTGAVVPAGEGDGQLAEILADAYASGYRGFVSLEPHLKVAGHSHGETGAELFGVAADALKKLLAGRNIPLSPGR